MGVPIVEAASDAGRAAHPRPAGDLRPASAGPAGHAWDDQELEDLGAPPDPPTLLRDPPSGAVRHRQREPARRRWDVEELEQADLTGKLGWRGQHSTKLFEVRELHRPGFAPQLPPL